MLGKKPCEHFDHADGRRLADGGGCNGIAAYRTALGAWASLDIPKFRDADISIRKGTEGRKRNRWEKEN